MYATVRPQVFESHRVFCQSPEARKSPKIRVDNRGPDTHFVLACTLAEFMPLAPGGTFKTAAEVAGVQAWDEASLVPSTKTVSTTTSSLPSALAAAALEAEDEEEVNRMLGKVREEKKVRWRSKNAIIMISIISIIIARLVLRLKKARIFLSG